MSTRVPDESLSRVLVINDNVVSIKKQKSTILVVKTDDRVIITDPYCDIGDEPLIMLITRSRTPEANEVIFYKQIYYMLNETPKSKYFMPDIALHFVNGEDENIPIDISEYKTESHNKIVSSAREAISAYYRFPCQ